MVKPQSVDISVSLDAELVEWLDQIADEFGIRSRGFLINRLLRELAGMTNQAPGSDP